MQKKVKPVQATLNHDYSWSAMGLFEISRKHSTVQTTKTIPSIIHAGDIYLKSGKDNILESVILHSDGVIHLSAQRDTIIKGSQEHSTIHDSGWSFGVSFFGSDALKNLAAGQYSQSVWSLADEDPLVAHLHKLKDTSGWNTIAEGTYTGIEAWRAFLQRCEAAKNNGSKTSFFAQRLGLLNSKGTFAPQLKFKVGTFDAKKDIRTTHKANIKAKKVTIDSGRDILLFDAPTIQAESAEFKAQNIKSTPAKNKQIAEQTNHELGLGIGTVTAETSTSTAQASTFDNAEVTARTIKVTTTGDADLSGMNMKAESVTMNIDGDLTLETVQDHAHTTSSTASVSLGTTIGGSASFHETTHETVSQVAGIDADHVQIKVNGTARLIGAVINAPDGSFTAHTIEHENIINTNTEEGLSLGAFVSTTDTSGIPGAAEFSVTDKHKEDTIRATVAPGIDVKTTNNISDLNRELEKIRSVLNQKDNSIRVVIPILDWDRFQESAQKVKEMFASNDPLTGAEFDDLVDSMHIQQPTIEEKEQMRRLVETLENNQESQESPAEKPPHDTQEPVAKDEPVESDIPTQSEEEAHNYSYTKYECETDNHQDLKIEIIKSETEQSEQTIGMPSTFTDLTSDAGSKHIDIDPYQGIVTVTCKGTTHAIKLRAHIDSFKTMANFQKISEKKGTLASHAPDTKIIVEQNHLIAVADFWNDHKETILEGTSIIVSLVPFLGPAKSLFDAAVGKDIITGQKLGLAERALIAGIVLIPGVKIFRRVISYGGKEALSFAKVGGNLGLIVEKKGAQRATSHLAKNAGKIEQTVTKSREIILEKVKTFEQARNKALEIIGDQLGHDSRPFFGHVGVGKGKIVGRESANHKLRWRLDHDFNKGAHINIDDFRPGKRTASIKKVIPFEGDEKHVDSLLKHLNR